ncbi:MAG: ATP-binding protein [Kofleriaceae bacterium]
MQSPSSPTDHWVQFYESEPFLAEKVADFVAEGLELGESAIIIASEPHRVAFTSRLRTKIADLDLAIGHGRLVLLDAPTMLDRIMVDGSPDVHLFTQIVGDALGTLSRASGGKSVRAYGEMVDVLWQAGQRVAAIRLEQLWNELRTTIEFKLLCAYVIDSFYKGGGLGEVCDMHSHVLAPEQEPSTSADVHALVAEIALRTQTEAALRTVMHDLQRSEEHARACKDDLEDFIDNAAIAIHRVDADGIIRYANRAELAMLGYSAEELVGRHIAELHVDRTVIADILARLVRGETLRDHEARLRAKDGHILHVQITSNLQTSCDGRTTTRCFTRDVTALNHAEAERARHLAQAEAARSEAEQANRAKDQFLAVLGHELRNPLSPILSAVQLMRIRGDHRSAREQDIIERQVNHLIHIVDDLLDIARITQGKLALHKRPLKIGALVSKALEIATPLCNERSHAVKVELPEHDVWIAGDETRLCQAITNLLTNAAKYTQAGGTIDVAVVEEGPNIVIRVTDNGIGIAPDLLPRIFDSFVQGHRVSERGVAGLGIGLALVRNLVSMHGGSVHATSAGLGHGSQFVVRLPMMSCDASARAHGDTALRRRIEVTPRNVLIVDDNEEAGMLLADMLGSVGYQVVLALDGERALELVDEFTPDAAILDIGLPTMSGYDLAAALRQRFGSALRLMAVTGYGQAQDRARALESGFDTHFLKPVSVQQVLAAIELSSRTG